MPSSMTSHLSDPELVAAVARLATAERDATASLIAHLAELYGRRLHEQAGFSSLFTFCTGALHLSEHEAYERMTAAKVVRRYPAVLGMLAGGRAWVGIAKFHSASGAIEFKVVHEARESTNRKAPDVVWSNPALAFEPTYVLAASSVPEIWTVS